MVAYFRVNSGTVHIHCLQRDPQGTIPNPQNTRNRSCQPGSIIMQLAVHTKKWSTNITNPSRIPDSWYPSFQFPNQLHVVLALALTLLQIQSLLRLGDGSTLDIILLGHTCIHKFSPYIFLFHLRSLIGSPQTIYKQTILESPNIAAVQAGNLINPSLNKRQ